MNNETLAPIFLDNKPVVLKDPKPKVSAVLAAGGRVGATEVKQLQTQAGTQGTLLRSDATLDRTSEPSKPIYLTSLARGQGSALPPAGSAPMAIVDEEFEARPQDAGKAKAATPWSKPVKAASADADEEAGDKVDAGSDAGSDADADADDDGDDRSPDAKSGE